MFVHEAAAQLEKELDLEISEGKIRRWETEGIITCKRDHDNNRIFTDHDYLKLKTALILNELNIPLDTIKDYFKNPVNPKHFVTIFKKTSTIKTLITWLEENIGKMTFDLL